MIDTDIKEIPGLKKEMLYALPLEMIIALALSKTTREVEKMCDSVDDKGNLEINAYIISVCTSAMGLCSYLWASEGLINNQELREAVRAYKILIKDLAKSKGSPFYVVNEYMLFREAGAKSEANK